MNDGKSYTASFAVDNSPRQVFDAVLNVRGWWSEDIEGRTDRLGAVFTFRSTDQRHSTDIVFELGKKGGKTELRLAHVGLSPEIECYDGCSDAWAFYVKTSLRNLISTGTGQPERKGG
jgi:hypothetical protein